MVTDESSLELHGKPGWSGLGVFVISLMATPRHSNLLSELGSQGIVPTLVKAIDGRSWGNDVDPSLVNIERFEAVTGRLPLGAEIGCALSHLECARLAQVSDLDFALVLEEDAIVVAELAPAVGVMASLGSTRPSVLQLCSDQAPILRKGTVIEVPGSPIRVKGKYYSPPGNTVAYLMNRSAINIFASRRAVEGVADWPPFADQIDFWAYFPWPVEHGDYTSSIQHSRLAVEDPSNIRSSNYDLLKYYLKLFRLKRAMEHSRSLGGLHKYLRWVIWPRTLSGVRRRKTSLQGSDSSPFFVR